MAPTTPGIAVGSCWRSVREAASRQVAADQTTPRRRGLQLCLGLPALLGIRVRSLRAAADLADIAGLVAAAGDDADRSRCGVGAGPLDGVDQRLAECVYRIYCNVYVPKLQRV